MARNEARFSTYSGAPSLQPSLAPTFETTSNRSSTQQYAAPASGTGKTVGTVYGATAAATAAGTSTGNPTATGSSTSLSATDPRTAELRSFASKLDKMNDARLDKQRYVMSGHKTEEVGKIALGAKLERALSRRMVGQDAVFRRPSAAAEKPEPIEEKPAIEAIEAN